jgi:hypothetical protein
MSPRRVPSADESSTCKGKEVGESVVSCVSPRSCASLQSGGSIDDPMNLSSVLEPPVHFTGKAFIVSSHP